MLHCLGKIGGKIIINNEVIEISGSFKIKKNKLRSWFLNDYVARYDENCTPIPWGGFFLGNTDPSTSYSFFPLSEANHCGARNMTWAINGIPNGHLMFMIVPNGFSFRPWKCQIQIIDSNGNQIFREYDGECPKINIKCNECPDGQIEIKTKQYPGYCCLSCSEIKSEIKNMASSLKGIKLHG